MSKRTNGEGSYIYLKESNRWRWTIMYSDHVTGHLLTKSLYDKSLPSLKEKVNQWLNDYNAGKVSGQKRIKIAEWVNIWLNQIVKQSCKKKTYENYDATVRNHILPAFGETRIDKITTVALQRYFNSLSSNHTSRTVATIRNHFIICFSVAVKFGYLTMNPAKLTSPPHITPRQTIALTTEELKLLDEVLATGSYLTNSDRKQDDGHIYLRHCYLNLFRLAVATGMREGEILALKWDKVDFIGKKLRVDLTVAPTRGSLHFETPKTTTSIRNVYLSSHTLNLLKTWKEEQQDFGKKYTGVFKNTNNLVFSTAVGSIISPTNFLHRCFSPALKIANIQGATFHTLRHTHASRLLASGVNVQVVAERLGHASVTTTMDIYAHLLPNMQTTALKKLEMVDNELNPKDENEKGGW